MHERQLMSVYTGGVSSGCKISETTEELQSIAIKTKIYKYNYLIIVLWTLYG